MADNKDKKLHQDEETVQANEAIEEEFYSDDNKSKQTSSPVPLVANNTAPLTSDDKKKD
ncbi:hypothetical protein [Planococcus sp. CAU13]|uniref:hypothetical protein n=1 Tax=Planococcus sp. CAU13 TaxID=1541197 RepID=UPI000A77B930|nr:hypothetical protein [Planococcus sp. CAU13]